MIFFVGALLGGVVWTGGLSMSMHYDWSGSRECHSRGYGRNPQDREWQHVDRVPIPRPPRHADRPHADQPPEVTPVVQDLTNLIKIDLTQRLLNKHAQIEKSTQSFGNFLKKTIFKF